MSNSPITDSLGLPIIHRYPEKFQAVVDEAAGGDPAALLEYAKALEYLADFNNLPAREACSSIEPIAALAAVNGGSGAKMLLAATARRLADALNAEPLPLSQLDEYRKLASWWHAVAIYEELARDGHLGAKAELRALLDKMSDQGVKQAAAALARLSQAELI